MPLASLKCFTFWKGIVTVQFQRAVHAGKLAFTGCTPVNETATKTDKQKSRAGFKYRTPRDEVNTEEWLYHPTSPSTN